MARRNRPGRAAPRPLSAGTVRTVAEHADGAWIVATWAGRDTGQEYTCPVCGGSLPASRSHLVVWPEDGAAADRRHVHTACWRRRAGQRSPVRW